MNQLRPSFRLPDFLRVTWVSEDAKAIWQPRLDRICDAWPRVAIELAAARRTDCVLRTVPPWMAFRLQAEAKRRGVAVVVLGVRGVAVPGYAFAPAAPAGKPFCYDVAIGTEAAARHMEVHWEHRDYASAYRIAGLPECCIEALGEDVKSQRIDPTGRLAEAARHMELDSRALPDPLWRWLHIERASFVPCSFYCEATKTAYSQWMDVAANSGYELEMNWLREILSWPVEWSALHGIAEIRTPILKFACTTDATYHKMVLRYCGAGYPPDGATGLTFPYRHSTRALLTSSASFRRGLENLIQIESGGE